MLKREKPEDPFDSPSVLLGPDDETPWGRFLPIAFQEPGTRFERTLDALRKGEDCADHESRDHCKDDAVLGHRLTFLDAEARAEVSNQICECHDGFTPFRNLVRAVRAKDEVRPAGVDESTRLGRNMRDTPLRPFSLRRAASPTGQCRVIHRAGAVRRTSLAWVIRRPFTDRE